MIPDNQTQENLHSFLAPASAEIGRRSSGETLSTRPFYTSAVSWLKLNEASVALVNLDRLFALDGPRATICSTSWSAMEHCLGTLEISVSPLESDTSGVPSCLQSLAR